VVSHGVLDALDVAAAEAFHLAAEFEAAADGVIVKNAEAVDDSDGAAGHLDWRCP
jgi:hypothetical protein